MESLLSLLKQSSSDKSNEDHSNRFYNHLVGGEWNVLLQSDTFQQVLKTDPKDVNVSDEELLHLAVGSLLTFVQHNFLGPRVDTPEENETLPQTKDILMQLKSDGEELNVNVEHAEWLLVSKKIFDHLYPRGDLSVLLWYQRCLLIHQRCVDDLTHSLYERFNANVNILEAALETVEKVTKIEIYLEILFGFVQYRRITKSEQWLKKLESMSGVSIAIEGLLGVRTKFQTNPLPQLTLRAEGFAELALPDAYETHGHVKLPSILKLDDDVRLDKVTFLNDAENVDTQLPALIQNMVLAKLYFLYVSQPKEQLALEEHRPYITSLIYQKCGPWTTRVAALFLNATSEASHKRTVDRSLRQIEELVHQVESTDAGGPSNADRLTMAFCSWFIPGWQMKEKLADVMVTLGMIKGALDIYQSVQCWQNVIDCYTVLELRHQAATVIRQLMEKNGPSVQLYCMLGDATDDVECYRQAWDFSGETSARAQRHWGNFYFVRKDYASAIEHLRRSIDINCMQEPTLLRLGYSALQLERWEEAAHAYRLYTTFESHGFESWNNLAKAYIMLGEKVRAHKILQEALKCNFNSWMVWENYLIVCVDTRNFEDALNAYERLIELKKYYDRQVLDILVRAIATAESDAEGQPCARLKKKAITLLGHACALRPNDGYLYALAAELEDVDLLRRCQKLQNAYRGYTQSNSQWSKEPESCLTVVNLCVELCEYSLKAFVEGKDDKERFVALRSQLSSARLAGQGCLRGARSEGWEQCVEPTNVLDELLHKLTSELTEAVGK